MLASLLAGSVAGARSMTPLAAVSVGAVRGALPAGNGAPRILRNPIIAAGAVALAAGELAGDKMKTAPDRIVPAGLLARLASGTIAGMALAPRRELYVAAALGATAAVAASFPTWAARMRAIRRYGQTKSGLVEDAMIVGSMLLIVHASTRTKSAAN